MSNRKDDKKSLGFGVIFLHLNIYYLHMTRGDRGGGPYEITGYPIQYQTINYLSGFYRAVAHRSPVWENVARRHLASFMPRVVRLPSSYELSAKYIKDNRVWECRVADGVMFGTTISMGHAASLYTVGIPIRIGDVQHKDIVYL